MTYSELETIVDNHRTAGEWEQILDLLTEANVATVVECVGKEIVFDQPQSLTRPDEILQDYLDLYTAISSGISTSAILGDYFTVYNITIAATGSEYRTAVDIAEQQLTDDGWIDPATKSTTDVQAEYVRRTDLQNPQPAAPC